jgi:hypothetical protein
MKGTIEEFLNAKNNLEDMANNILKIVDKYKGKLDIVDEVLLTQCATKCTKYSVKLNSKLKNTEIDL